MDIVEDSKTSCNANFSTNLVTDNLKKTNKEVQSLNLSISDVWDFQDQTPLKDLMNYIIQNFPILKVLEVDIEVSSNRSIHELLEKFDDFVLPNFENYFDFLKGRFRLMLNLPVNRFSDFYDKVRGDEDFVCHGCDDFQETYAKFLADKEEPHDVGNIFINYGYVGNNGMEIEFIIKNSWIIDDRSDDDWDLDNSDCIDINDKSWVDDYEIISK